MELRTRTAVGVALAATLLATAPAMAQTSLRQTVANQLNQHNITVENLDSLSNTQLAEIELMLSTAEGSDSYKRAKIQALMAEQGPCEGNPQLRQDVANQLAEHGIQVQNFDNITGTELVVIKTILDGTESDANKRAHIQRVFAADAPVAGNGYLRADTEQCIRSVGADLDLDALTPDQMLQIQLIASGSESDSAKRTMMENLAR